MPKKQTKKAQAKNEVDKLISVLAIDEVNKYHISEKEFTEKIINILNEKAKEDLIAAVAEACGDKYCAAFKNASKMATNLALTILFRSKCGFTITVRNVEEKKEKYLYWKDPQTTLYITANTDSDSYTIPLFEKTKEILEEIKPKLNVDRIRMTIETYFDIPFNPKKVNDDDFETFLDKEDLIAKDKHPFSIENIWFFLLNPYNHQPPICNREENYILFKLHHYLTENCITEIYNDAMWNILSRLGREKVTDIVEIETGIVIALLEQIAPYPEFEDVKVINSRIYLTAKASPEVLVRENSLEKFSEALQHFSHPITIEMYDSIVVW